MNEQNPYQENLENVLEKYGRDIVKSVKDGKIDPVIGRDDEIRSMGFDLSHITIDYSVNDSVRVTDGALKDFVGIVQEINKEKHKVKVLVSMFGRETPVELEFSQVQKV